MARLLDENGITYVENKRFETIDRKGRPNYRQVDFWLFEPIEVYLFCHPIQAIELKSGRMDGRCIEQQRELYDAGIYTDIVITRHIDLWERYGLLRRKKRVPTDNKQ